MTRMQLFALTAALTAALTGSLGAQAAARTKMTVQPESKGTLSQAQGPNAKLNVIEVKMIDISPTAFAFSPAKITVKQGAIVRFTQTKVNVHNIEFKGIPAGADLGDLKVGPYLMSVDQVHEFTIDQRFVPGTYDYVCTPHELMGMKGQIIVTK